MKRHFFRSLCVIGVVAFVGLAGFVYWHDSASVDSYRPASAVALGTDGADTGTRYSYRVGDRLCRGSTSAAIDPGASLTVYYDPRDPCTGVSTSPSDKRLGNQAALLFTAFNLAAWLGLIRLWVRQSRGMTWQARAAAKFPAALIPLWVGWCLVWLTRGVRDSSTDAGVFAILTLPLIAAALLAIWVIWSIQSLQDRKAASNA